MGNVKRYVDLSVGSTVIANDSSGNWFITESVGDRIIKVTISHSWRGETGEGRGRWAGGGGRGPIFFMIG